MKLIRVLLFCFLVTSCAPIYVNFDYEKQHDFTQYKTYNYYSDIETGLNELDSNRLLDVLDKAMIAKGYTLSSTPDFFINITSREFHQSQNGSVGVGVGGTGGNVGGGISIGLPIGQANVNRQIVFDFIDEDGIGLFWQAVSESNYNPKAKPEKKEERFSAIVAKVLAGFPPEKK